MPLDGALPEPVAVPEVGLTLGRSADNDVVVDEPSVSRRHAHFSRRGEHVVVQDLDSRNGIAVDGRELRGGVAQLRDGDVLEVGDVRLRFDQPRPTGVGGRTIYGTAESVIVASPRAPEATGSLARRPYLHPGWAMKQAPGSLDTWLVSSAAGNYLSLDSRDAFILRNIDGSRTVRELLVVYAAEYGELALPRIERLLCSLETAGFASLGGDLPPQAGAVRRIARRIYQALLRLELSVRGIDPLAGWLYRRGGWLAFTSLGKAIFVVTVVVGLWAFTLAGNRQHLFAFGGAGWWGAVVVGVVCVLALTAHELAHALAVKSYGRRVRRGGFMITMGMPFAFVDTSDMWFGTRWPRVVVALSGPVSTAAIAGVAAMGAAWLPGSIGPALCFQAAYALYVNTAYNFNPIMPLDGYQALVDACRVPRLREQASHYLLRGFWKDLRVHRRPGPREVGLLGYGCAVVVGGYAFTALALVAWRDRLGPFLSEHLPQPVAGLATLGVIVLVTFPVWVSFFGWLRRMLRRGEAIA